MSKEKLLERTAKISDLATSFCTQKLNQEYFELVEKLVGKLSRKRPSPILRGKEEIWAASIIHSLGQVNFLYDNSFEPFITLDELHEYFGTKKSSVGAKAAEIRKMFKMDSFTNTDFVLDELTDKNPLNNMVLVDGFIVPISSLPEEYQTMVKEARAQGKDIQFNSK